MLAEANALHETLHLATIGCDVVLRDVYEKVQLATEQAAPPA